MSSLFLTPGRRLRLLDLHDSTTQWWSLDETRFCRKCESLLVGKDIRVELDEREEPSFRCPSEGCSGTFSDWEYPQLHL